MKTSVRIIQLLLLFSVFLGCEKSSEINTIQGKGGSMARFAIAGDYLYTVDRQKLHVFDVSHSYKLSKLSTVDVGMGIETIFPYHDKLFIGSERGMFVYDIQQPEYPKFISQFAHVLSCDPVVVNPPTAYVTLRSGGNCRTGFVSNQLDIIDISDLHTPLLIRSFPMESPHGLAVDDSLLFICHGNAGLGIYNVKNPQDISTVKTISGIETFDLILNDKIMMIIGASGFHQYDYSDISNIKHLSSLPIGK